MEETNLVADSLNLRSRREKKRSPKGAKPVKAHKFFGKKHTRWEQDCSSWGSPPAWAIDLEESA